MKTLSLFFALTIAAYSQSPLTTYELYLSVHGGDLIDSLDIGYIPARCVIESVKITVDSAYQISDSLKLGYGGHGGPFPAQLGAWKKETLISGFIEARAFLTNDLLSGVYTWNQITTRNVTVRIYATPTWTGANGAFIVRVTYWEAF